MGILKGHAMIWYIYVCIGYHGNDFCKTCLQEEENDVQPYKDVDCNFPAYRAIKI